MSRRVLITVFAALALIAAGCGDDDADDAGDTPDEPGVEETTDDEAMDDDAGDSPPMSPAELSVEDQSGDGTTVQVASVTLPADGFIAVHADDGGPGPVIGSSDLLPAGESTDVEITLDEAVSGDTTLWPMAHIDTNLNGTYDFGSPPEPDADGPATFADGEVAVLPLDYSIE
ncbi:MAG: hypothetical protein U5K29_09965 [Acidimicrobiales bacterium]|nr:hypothetical protein [Acidimicrobiales bacterium]